MSELSLALVFLVVLFAATVKGTIGFGLPLISVPVMSNILDARTTVVVMSIPVLLSNAVMIFNGSGSREDVRRLGTMLVSLVIGTVLGAQLLATLDQSTLSLLVGFSAVALAAMAATRVNPVLPESHERLLRPVIGLAAGLLGGTTNIFGPVMTAYLHSLRLPKKKFVFSISLLFLVGGIAQVLSYLQLGLYSSRTLLYSLLACIPILLGTLLGMKLQDRLPLKLWNALVLLVIFLSGLNLIARGLHVF